MDCGTWAIVGHLEDGTTHVMPLYCKKWACRRCADFKKRALLRRLDNVKATTLLTLTCKPARYKNQREAFVRMSIAVNQLFKRIRRRWPDSEVEYFLVWEKTRAGWPHAHLLLRAPYIPQGWLSVQWSQLTGARIVDIRAVHTPDEIVSYIAKYLTKGPAAPEGFKRFRHSMRFFDKLMGGPIPGSLAAVRWSLVREHPQGLAENFSYAGYTVQAHPDGSYTAFPPGHQNAPLLDSMSLHPEIGLVRA